jgi:hypothetical protein
MSYSRVDGKSIVSKLEADLNANGISTWSDRLIRPGVPFGDELERAINNSFAMLALITSGACKSHWIRGEWCYAISRGDVTIIPVVAPGFPEDSFPIELIPISRIYLAEEYDSSLEDIISFLNFARENPPIW